MDVVYGGGRYGSDAVEYLISEKKQFIVIDENPNCLANTKFKLEQGRFVQGGIKELMDILERFEVERLFPTAPIHLSAAILMEKLELEVWFEGINRVLSGIPAKIIVSSGKGSVVVSYNRDKLCKRNCESPDICPVTGILKPCPMYRLLSFAIDDGFVVKSHQVKPGLGALNGKEIHEMLEWAEDRDEIVVATACRCHGVVTALKK
ncbi:hypothetical protein Asulf_01093 [Archaeoglobus sulfaticallidus PM70-1]|uniref:Uncharacterized protein n=1 Tax=Archaeoglobus sulfaticallidus PM70-1 TaxID=387631 RepID=N0BBV9_9EURY|nr:hypothetical protein [Archaeoglobus sulfaticallidus]AGK61094.1 hypothetical protein Asulf_01093 [Archaeoglobus sulfaticallidus PM70-1]